MSDRLTQSAARPQRGWFQRIGELQTKCAIPKMLADHLLLWSNTQDNAAKTLALQLKQKKFQERAIADLRHGLGDIPSHRLQSEARSTRQNDRVGSLQHTLDEHSL